MSDKATTKPDHPPLDVQRIEVPGRWLYVTRLGEAMTSTFVPERKANPTD